MASASPRRGAETVIAYREEGRPVQLVFDTWTPRPHFIVNQLQPKEDASSSELQATYEIIGNFLQRNSQFDRDAILSFHRGQWYQQHTGKWHAHLCVPRQPYLEQATAKITNIPQNRQWQGAKTVAAGMNGLYNRKRTEYLGYQKDCIQTALSKESAVTRIPLSTFNSNEFQLAWTTPTPRIGVIARSTNSIPLSLLYTFMSEVRINAERTLREQDRNFTNFGCHLCLYVSGPSGTNATRRQGQILSEDGRLNTNSNLVGYIQMDASQYVQWLPSAIKNVWLEAFKREEHFVHT